MNPAQQEQSVHFMLGKLLAEQTATLELIRKHIDEDSKKWDHIYAKTDRQQDFIKYVTGVAAVLAAGATYLLHKITGV